MVSTTRITVLEAASGTVTVYPVRPTVTASLASVALTSLWELPQAAANVMIQTTEATSQSLIPSLAVDVWKNVALEVAYAGTELFQEYHVKNTEPLDQFLTSEDV